MSNFLAKPHHAVSLRRQWFKLIAGVVGLFAVGIGLSVWVSLESSARSGQADLELEARHVTVGLTRVMDYHRALLAKIAEDPELLDLMRVGTFDQQHEWALSRQRLLPDLLGFALLDPQGQVLGEAEALRVGPRCVDDLRRATDLENLQPLMHDEIPGLAHIDLVTIVREPDGRVLGGIFLSLRLTQLQRVIDDASHPGHALKLIDATGKTLALSGAVDGRAQEVRVAIPDTGWTLIARSPVLLLTPDGKKQAIVGLLTLAAVLALLAMTLVRLRRSVLRDVAATRDALAALAREEPVPEIVPHYAEFEPTVADINHIALNLQDQRVHLEYLSLTDPLTGLPNRRAFENHFAQAQGLAAREHKVALVLLDVDHFKAVNDTLGHGVGDQVLRALAESLKALTRRADLAARLAGDEFVVLLTNVEADGLDAWYQRLADRFRNELGALGMELKAGLSAGQTWLRKTPDDTLGEALARADRALYQAKARGRGQLATEVAE